jgi:hypothetical protein
MTSTKANFLASVLIAMIVVVCSDCGKQTSTGGSGSSAGSSSVGSSSEGSDTTADAARLQLLARSSNSTGTLETVSPPESSDGSTPSNKLKAHYVTTDPAVNRLLGLTEGQLDINNLFFKKLGTNKRTCGSCHLASAAWGVSTVQTQAIFSASNGGIDQDHLGLSGIFEPFDGANCPVPTAQFNPSLPLGNPASPTPGTRAFAYSALLGEGLIRIPLPVPAGAEFDVTATADPYTCAMTCGNGVGPACATAGATLSEYRRPLPTTNERALSTIMFDARESIANTVNITSPACVTPPCPIPVCTTPPCNQSGSLQNQANNATAGHAQGVGLTSAQEQEIVRFQFQNITAQSVNNVAFDASGNTIPGAGDLSAGGARGGPNALHAQTTFIGHNDNFGDCIDATNVTGCRRTLAPLGGGARGAPFNPSVFTIYNAWNGSSDPAKASIARGQALFNTLPIPITNVSGINDEPAFCVAAPSDPGCTSIPKTGPKTVNGGCVTCHDAPNFGNHTVVAALNIGLADPQPASASSPIGGLAGPGVFLPLYTVTCNAAGNAARIASSGTAGCTVGGPDCTAGGPVNTDPARGAMFAPTCGSIKVTDVGRALITGKAKQVGRVKGPILRGMPARAPFFHNGFGTDPGKVIDFYDDRFNLGLSAQQQADLINFLNAL